MIPHSLASYPRNLSNVPSFLCSKTDKSPASCTSAKFTLNNMFRYDGVGLNGEDLLMSALTTSKFGYTLKDVMGYSPSHNEKGAKDFIESLFRDQHDLSLRFDVSQEVAEWKSLPDFANTFSVQRPDVSVYMPVKIPNPILNEVLCVVLVVEVHSGTQPRQYINTARKTVLGLATQLRHLRRVSDMVTVIGFTFPRMETKSFVTKVTVTWKRLHMWYKFESLQLDEVKDRIKEAVTCNIHCLREDSHGRYFPPGHLLRMTTGELQMFRTYIGAGNYQQLPSDQSVVVGSANTVYKGELQPKSAFYWLLLERCNSAAAAEKNRFLLHSTMIAVEGYVFKGFQRLEDRMLLVDEA